MRHRIIERLFGGIGMLALVYSPIRYLEDKPAIFMLMAFPLVGWGLGYLLDMNNTGDSK